MGGTIMLALPLMGAIGAVIILAAIFAAVAFIGATIISIVFAAGTKKRRAEGRKLGGLIAVPIVLYVVSIPILVWFGATFVFPIVDDQLNVRYDDCRDAVVGHEPAELQDCLQTLTAPLPSEGKGSWESLLRLAVEYGDDECVQVIFDQAERQQVSLDVDDSLPGYDSEGELTDATPPLLLALGFDYSTSDMIRVLLDEGADPNITVGEDAVSRLDVLEGETPLHLACQGVARAYIYVDDDERDALQLLEETDEVIDLLLASGADPSAVDGKGRTPWDVYVARVESFVEEGELTEDEAAAILAAREPSLLVEEEFLV